MFTLSETGPRLHGFIAEALRQNEILFIIYLYAGHVVFVLTAYL